MAIKKLSERYLSPSERLSEIIYGLMMVLTVTTSVALALPGGEADTRIMMFAALGSNTAWGIVDGVMYVATSHLGRRRYVTLLSSLRSAKDNNAAAAIIEEELESTIIGTLEKKERTRISREVLKSASKSSSEEAWVTRDDLLGGLSSFLLVFFAALPVVVPFVLVYDFGIAVRLSNAIAIVLLFAVGYQWGHYVSKSRLHMGIAMVLIGLVIVAVAVILGG